MSKFTIEFTPEQEARLKSLATALGETKAGTLREALKLLNVIVRETREGDKSVVIKDNQDPSAPEKVIVHR